MHTVILDLLYTKQIVSTKDNPCHRIETVFLIQIQNSAIYSLLYNKLYSSEIKLFSSL